MYITTNSLFAAAIKNQLKINHWEWETPPTTQYTANVCCIQSTFPDDY